MNHTRDSMEITEEKIRKISLETRRFLGPHANPQMIKKVVREVLRRLSEEITPLRKP